MKRPFAIILLAFIAILVAMVFRESIVINRQQCQINQLCAAMPSALCRSEPKSFDGCEFKNLKSGKYALCFANYGDNSAVLAHQLSNGKTHYVHVRNIPAESLKEWKLFQIISLGEINNPEVKLVDTSKTNSI
jgi:hypothetical protein